VLTVWIELGDPALGGRGLRVEGARPRAWVGAIDLSSWCKWLPRGCSKSNTPPINWRAAGADPAEGFSGLNRRLSPGLRLASCSAASSQCLALQSPESLPLGPS